MTRVLVGLGCALAMALANVQVAVGGKLPLSASPHHLSFGSFPINSGFTGTLTVSFTNTTNAAIDTGNLDYSGDVADFAVNATDCAGTTIGSGSSCSMDVKFGPADLGHLTADIFVTDRSNNHIGKVSLSGRGV